MTNNPQAAALFRQRYGSSPNLMTPDIVARRMIAAGNLAVELSTGRGIIPGTELWGVTVIIASDVNAHHDLSESFGSREEAEAYIETLRDWRPQWQKDQERAVSQWAEDFEHIGEEDEPNP